MINIGDAALRSVRNGRRTVLVDQVAGEEAVE
jgi:hypothetical protein